MLNINVVNDKNKAVGSVALKEEIFGLSPSKALLHASVVMQLACSRQGTASTKRRGEVSGSGKKPWKQKHTGRARAGSVRSPLWRHGGSVFGPKPRSYQYAMPKKQYRAALQHALSSKNADGQLIVLDEIILDQPKTKLFLKVLESIACTGKTLMVVPPDRDDIFRAGRNLPGVKLLRVNDLNVYDILLFDRLVILKCELEKLQEVWQ
jgi:large subunit ribosomal protein L4